MLRFVDSVLDFGLVQHCRDQCTLVEIKNFSSIEASWRLNDEVRTILYIFSVCENLKER